MALQTKLKKRFEQLQREISQAEDKATQLKEAAEKATGAVQQQKLVELKVAVEAIERKLIDSQNELVMLERSETEKALATMKPAAGRVALRHGCVAVFKSDGVWWVAPGKESTVGALTKSEQEDISDEVVREVRAESK